MSETYATSDQTPPREPNIKLLELHFPHGATSGECQRIAMYAEKVVGARVSEGGYKPSGPFELHADAPSFEPNQYSFTLGYKP